MKIAHLILCHTNAPQVGRLINSLSHKDAHFYIHVDLKTDIAPYEYLTELPGVILIKKRIKVYWGGYSIVQATINGFEQIRSSGFEYGYINLLSGQDYPLKSTVAIHRFFENNPGKAFVDTRTHNTGTQPAQNRVTQYYFGDIKTKGTYTAERLATRFLKRKFPETFPPVGCSQWFTITPQLLAYTLEFLNHNPSIKSKFKYMWAPDELVFPSILFNSKHKDAIVHDCLRYVDWSEEKPSPKILTMADADALIHSDKLFARKFDMNTDTQIMDYLDKFIASGNN